jgi:glycerol-3-phosphate dehydrogenase
LDTAGQYLDRKPTRADVLSVFAGLRPLAAPKGKNKSTKEISRSHKLMVSSAGLVTITGGKWTTFRKMAEDTVNTAIKTGGLVYVPCSTHHHSIHGHTSMSDHSNHLSMYGSDAAAILELIKSELALAECLHPSYEYVKAEIVWAARHEMARTIEDVLARRIRILFLDARAAIAMAPEVAQLLAIELNRDQQWIDDQLKSFVELAKGFLLASNEESFTLNLTHE